MPNIPIKFTGMPFRYTGLNYWRYWIRRGFIEYPEFCYMAIFMQFGLALSVYRCIYEAKHPNSLIRSYKDKYTIYRSDDPRSYRIRCSPDLPPDDPHIRKV